MGATVLMLSVSPLMTAIAFVAVPMTLFVSSTLAKHMRKYYVAQQKLLGSLNGHIEEMVTGYSTVVAYGKEEEEIEKFNKVSDELRKTGIRAKIWGGVMGPCMNIIGNMQYLLIACIGGVLAIYRGKPSVGGIQKLLGYSKKFTRPINELANQYTSILTALAGAERIFEIMDTPEEIDEGVQNIEIDKLTGAIEFEDIDFSYVEGEQVLRKFNLSVKAGQKIAIVGATAPQGVYSEENLRQAQAMGYHTVFWSLAYVDWQDAQPTREQAFSKLLPRTHNGAVILLHSTSKTNAEILDELLTKWEEMGYRFGTLEELFATQ